MAPNYYILLEKTPVKIKDPMQWAEWFSKSTHERIVAHNEVNGKVVRTVFTGLAFEEDKRGRGRLPCLFEGYIWNWGESEPEWTERFCSYEEAVKGHQRMVDALHKGEFEN